MARLVGLTLLVALACVDPKDRCATDGGCATGHTCNGGFCTQSPTSESEGCAAVGRNLLRNAGFECGDPPSGWFAQGGSLAAVTRLPHSGARAAHLTAGTSTTANLWYQADAVAAPGTKTFCARAWMRGTAHDGRLTLRRLTSSSSGIDETFSSPVSAEWTQVPPYHPLKVTSSGDQKLLFKVWMPDATQGAELDVDDVELWESSDGLCEP